MPHIDEARARALAKAITRIPMDTFLRIDQEEPEFQAFQKLIPQYQIRAPDGWDPALALSGLYVGLIDFQENARSLWRKYESAVQEAGFPDDPKAIEGMVMSIARGRRLARTKVARLERALRSGFTAWFVERGIQEIRDNAWETWRNLALRMGDPVDRKTIVMAMKALLMETLAATDAYPDLPPDVPIMVDSRIARLTRSSGLLRMEANEEGLSDDEFASKFKDPVVSAWRRVVGQVQPVQGPRFNALRLDSLLWQVGDARTREGMAQRLRTMGLEEAIAQELASELLWHGDEG